MIIEQWTYITLMYSIATFPGIDVSRTWMHLAGPFETKEKCNNVRKVDKESDDVSVSQCMPMLNARALTEPYNKGSFVLETHRDTSDR
ncbi:MAG: hypothetical protein ACPGTP_03665 [Bacteroidia bacterium]